MSLKGCGDLPRCPFCRSFSVKPDLRISPGAVECAECGASGPQGVSENEVCDLWSTRPGEDWLREALKELTEFVEGLRYNQQCHCEFDIDDIVAPAKAALAGIGRDG